MLTTAFIIYIWVKPLLSFVNQTKALVICFSISSHSCNHTDFERLWRSSILKIALLAYSCNFFGYTRECFKRVFLDWQNLNYSIDKHIIRYPDISNIISLYMYILKFIHYPIHALLIIMCQQMFHTAWFPPRHCLK